MLDFFTMSQSPDDLFDAALERYKAGEEPKTLIPVFKDICAQSPKTGSAWSCLAWLYLLDNQPEPAYKAAQKAVKLSPGDPQIRLNLVMAMLETEQKGVRQHVDAAKQLMSMESEFRSQIEENIKDGLSRKPDWNSLKRVKNWLFES